MLNDQELQPSEVSILVLVDVALEADIRYLCLTAGWSFNPCSRGCCARSQRARIHTRRLYRVSILVLVDVALEAHHEVLKGDPERVSILVLVDVALEGWLR